MKTFLWVGLCLAMAFAFGGLAAGEGSLEAQGMTMPPATFCGTATVCDLVAGRSIDVGSVTVANDADDLYVTFTLEVPDATFGTLHLGVYTSLLEVPGGGTARPAPGQLTWQADASGLTSYTFVHPLSRGGLPVECGTTTFYVVAHAEVRMAGGTETGFGGSETGFGGCNPGPNTRGNNGWWFYMTHVVQCCDAPPPHDGSYETAFAKPPTSGSGVTGYVWTTAPKSNPERYASLDLIRNRWGWAANLAAPGTWTWPLWAGAGLNDTANGARVGDVTVTWDGTQVTVAYDLVAGFTTSEVHVYAGDDAPKTTAPGQYGYVGYFDPGAAHVVTDPTPVTDSRGGIWLVVHAVVYGDL